jgi:predicted nucleic acid-binding protein
MIVLDASVVVELLTNRELSHSIRRELVLSGQSFAIPHLVDVEVASALCNLTAGGRIDPHRADEYLHDLAMLPAERFPHSPLFGRVWELRHKFTVYDAVYIALAEAMDVTLYTTDVKLRRGHRARVIVIAK